MQFGMALEELAKSHDEEQVARYADELLKAAKRFDVAVIEELLRHFDKILTQHHHKRINHE